MAVDSGVLEQLEAQGMGAVREEQGLCALELAMSGAGASGVVGMVPLVWPVLLGLMGGEVPSFLTGFARLVREEVRIQNTVGDTALVAQLSTQEDAVAQRAALESMVLSQVHEASGVSVAPHDPLMESGVDSLASTELQNSLQRELGAAVKLPSTMMFDYPTVASIAEFAQSALAPKAPSSLRKCMLVSHRLTDICVDGIQYYAPLSHLGLWAVLFGSGSDTKVEPNDRFSFEAVTTNLSTNIRSLSNHGYFIENPELFDCHKMSISKGEARSLDPHQRILLEVAYKSFVSVQQQKQELRGSRTGIFVGCCSAASVDMSLNGVTTGFMRAGAGPLAGRLSYVFDLKGPSILVDTMCSSSFVALDTALQTLENTKCSQALVAGINLFMSLINFVTLEDVGILSPDRRCNTFDASANGIVTGEACVTIVISPRAVHAIHHKATTLLSRTVINQDGRSATMMAPNGPAQMALIQDALYGIDVVPQILEVHGTGTSIGDPIEVGAIEGVFAKIKGAQLVLGAIKTRHGHKDAASGIIGLFKSALSLQHHCVPPNLNFKRLNPKIGFTDLAVVMPSQIQGAWCMVGLNVAECKTIGMSSFAMTGTNTHAVLQTNTGCTLTSGHWQGHTMAYDQTSFVWWRTNLPTGDSICTTTLLEEHASMPYQDRIDADKRKRAPPQIESMLPDQRITKLEVLVLEHMVLLGLSASGLDEPLLEAGLDSQSALELRTNLSDSIGISLPSTLIFDYPTISRLVEHIASCWEEPVEAHAVQFAVPQGDMLKRKPTAMTGSGCVLPGVSNNIAKFWCVLSNAVDPICGVPSGRWDERQHAESSEQVGSSKCYVQCGGFVAGLEGFDNTHFRISEAEAKQMDPQQRAVLQVCLVCLNLSGTDCACCV